MAERRARQRAVLKGVGVALAAIVGFIVLDGAFATGSLLIHDGAWDVAIALVELVLLGLLEGLEVAISALRFFRDAPWISPPVQRLATYFTADTARLRAFLAGRQFLVVSLVVSTAGLLTPRDPGRLAFVPFALPNPVPLLLSVGLFQALLLAWVAQVFPKSVAAAAPLWYLEMPGASGMAKLCVWLGESPLFAASSGLTALVIDRTPLQHRERPPAPGPRAHGHPPPPPHPPGLGGPLEHPPPAHDPLDGPPPGPGGPRPLLPTPDGSAPHPRPRPPAPAPEGTYVADWSERVE